MAQTLIVANERVRPLCSAAEMRTIYVTAERSYRQGDITLVEHVLGFWLDDVAKDAVGAFCIEASLVDAPNVGAKAYKAGARLQWSGSRWKSQGNNYNPQYDAGIVHQDVKSSDKRMLLVWGRI